MKKTVLLSFMLLLVCFGFAQVSKQQAINSVMNSIVGNDADRVNVYMEPLSKTDSYYKMSQYDSILSPYANYWLFFIDDMPEYGWGHDCRYVFVNSSTGATSVVNSQKPPYHHKSNLDGISEPISFMIPLIFEGIAQCEPNAEYHSNDGKFALLFSGGEDFGENHSAFWNALCHSYSGLLEKGFRKENIFVLSCDGDVANPSLDFDQDGLPDIMDVPCTFDNIDMVMDSLSNIMQEGDLLYVYGTMHGYPDGNNTYLGLWNGERLYDYQFANMLSRINCSQFIVNLWACHSGGMSEEIIAIPNGAKKVVLTCTGNGGVLRDLWVCNRTGMDTYNFFMNSAFRGYYPDYNQYSPWDQGFAIGHLQDRILFEHFTVAPYDIDFDLSMNGGNENGVYNVGESIHHTMYYDSGQFGNVGVKHYECGFDTIDDLLSLRGITGIVTRSQTVSGSFHIEDALSIRSDTLLMEDSAKFYLFDADLTVGNRSLLQMGDETSVIARSGKCRVIVRGSLQMGSNITFEAKDDASLEIIFENDSDVFISDATFINCILTLPRKDVVFRDCQFLGTPVLAQISVLNSNDEAVSISNCTFSPNGKTISNAIHIKGYPSFSVRECTIDNPDGNGSFAKGIYIQRSGAKTNRSIVYDNEIAHCTEVGLEMYSSTGNVVMNRIHDNRFGVKLLNNSNIRDFSGWCQAQSEGYTQYIYNNERNEVYMTGNSIPQTFKYNAITDDDNVAFLYHDAFVGEGQIDDSLHRSAIDITYNYWGTSFVPATHLFTNYSGGYQYLPTWSLGVCDENENNGGRLIAQADSLAELGDYVDAQSLYKQVVQDYSTSVSAETALKSLLNLEKQFYGNYSTLKNYYDGNEVIASEENLSHLASSLANKCDEEMENFEDAIAWYEAVLENPGISFNDSVFAAIDLGDLYLEMEGNGEKGICGKMKQYVPQSLMAHRKQTEYALSLLPNAKETNMETEIEIPPITDLEVSTIYNDTVLLTWGFPGGYDGSPLELSWLLVDSTNNLAQYGYDSYGGSLFDEQDLQHCIGWTIESVSFYKASNWTHIVYVWQQKQGEDMHVLYSQQVPEDAPFGLNTIVLDENLQIEPFARYWFGLRIKHEENQTGYQYPIATVSGVGVGMPGKSDLWMDPYVNWWSYPPNHYWIKMNLINAMDKEDDESAQKAPEGQSFTGYRIYRNGVQIKEIPYGFVTYFTDTEFTKGVDLEYCVTAVYGDEESEPVCATATITGVGEAEDDGQISISPNPTNGLVNIEGATVAEVLVYNALGQLVKAFNGTNVIALDGAPDGLYLLRITLQDCTIQVRKVMLKH